jgi:hypothetical protein
VCPKFVKGYADALRPIGLKEVRYDSYEEHIVVALQVATCTRVGIMLPHGLEAGCEICEYPYPIVRCERGKAMCMATNSTLMSLRVSFLLAVYVYIDGGAGGNVNHNRVQPGLTLNVGTIRIDPIFHDKFRRPRVWEHRDKMIA